MEKKDSKSTKEKETKLKVNKENNKNRHEVEITIEGEKWQEALKKSYEKNNKKAKIDGFRPGKAPYDVFVKHYGIESLFEEAINSVIDFAFEKALSDNKIEPVVQPSVAIKEVGKDKAILVFVIITKPEVKINKYKGLNIKKDKLKVTKEEINDEIDHLLEQYAELEIKDGKVENGDTVILDYEGFKDNVPFEGGKTENYSLEIGSNTFIPGFEEQLIGMGKDEEKEIEVTFPEDYHAENLKGAKAIFKVKIHEIKVRKNRELNEEFFEDLGMDGVNSKETLEQSIKEHIESHKKVDIENKFIDELMEAIGKNTEVDIPDEMVSEEVERLLKRAEENLRYQGVTLDLYYQFTKTTETDLRNQLEPEAFKNVLYRLILEKVIEIEDIKVEDSEISKEISETAKKYNAKEDEVVNELGGRDMVKYDLEVRKAFDKLTEYNEAK